MATYHHMKKKGLLPILCRPASWIAGGAAAAIILAYALMLIQGGWLMTIFLSHPALGWVVMIAPIVMMLVCARLAGWERMWRRLCGTERYHSVDAAHAGDRAEADFANLLGLLPRSSHVFTNYEFELRGSHETDVILVQDGTVYVCEVKNWRGKVDYLPDTPEQVLRTKADGTVSRQHSPIHQVTAHIETLRDALYRKLRVRVPVYGMVIMMHPDCSHDLNRNGRVRVLDHPSLRRFLAALPPANGACDTRRIVNALLEISRDSALYWAVNGKPRRRNSEAA